MDSDILELKEEVQEFIKETHKIHHDFMDTVTNINLEFRSVDSIFAKHGRQKKLYLELDAHLKELKKEFAESEKERDELEGLEEQLKDIKVVVDDLGKSKRKTGSYFVSMWMGKVNVRIWNAGDRRKFKTEYNSFKERWMFIFFVFPAFQLYFGFSVLMNQIQALCFLFYYTSLAIRENILALNGSRIEAWWIYHHYWSIVMSLLTLMIETQDLVYINYFFFYQGLVMLLQNDYQKRRDYTRKALAKKTELDPTTSEVIDETPHSTYKLLIPALYTTYITQFIISIYFLWLSSFDSNSRIKCVQIIMMSICWFVISVGNASTLSKVLKQKQEKKQKKN